MCKKKQLLTLWSTAAISVVAAMSVPVTATIAAPSAVSKASTGKHTNDACIVRLAEMPVTAYDGNIKGLAATRARNCQKLDPNSPQVVNYTDNPLRRRGSTPTTRCAR